MAALPPPPSAPLGATAAEFAQRRFDGPTRAREERVSVGTTVTRLLPNNPRRVFWLVVNRSANNGALGLDASLTSANGVLVGAQGGFASMSVEEDGEAVAYEVLGINEVASGTWYVMEVTRV